MSVFTRIVRTGLVVIGLSVATVVYAEEAATYTTVAQFNDAANFRHSTEGVTDATDGSLVITNEVHILPYLWVACSSRGTVVRIATCTVDPITGRTGVQPGDVLGEYQVAPNGRARHPPRTPVHLDGDALPRGILW